MSSSRHRRVAVSGPLMILLTLVLVLIPLTPFTSVAQAPVAQEMLTSNGNMLGISADWTMDLSQSTDAVLAATTPDSQALIGDYPVGQDLASLWNQIEQMKAGETPLEVRQMPDGGPFGLWMEPGNTPDMQFVSMVHLTITPATGSPVMLMLATNDQAIARVLELLDGIVVNGEPGWQGLNHAAVLDEIATNGASTMDVFGAGQPATSGGSGTTGQAPAAANQFTSVNGTVVGYPGDWSPDPSMEAPDGISLRAGDTSLLVGDFAEEQDPETLFNTFFETLAKADQGPTPDGGYYGLAYGQDNGGRNYYLLFRFLYAEDTGTPVIVLLNAPVDTFTSSLDLAHGVTINGMSVLEGLDDAALLATFENGGSTGTPIFTGDQASDPVPTEAPDVPSTSGTEITGPAGTLMSWSDDWAYEQLEGVPPSVVVLYGAEVPATIMIFEGAAGQGVDAMWAEYSSTGGEILDEGQSPDGGFYEISYNAASASPVGSTTPSYTLTRAYAAETAPILVSVMINGEEFQPSLDAARDVTTNGVSILGGVDDAALIATFENGAPTGSPIFTGGAPSAPVDEPSGGNGGDTDPGSGGTLSRDIIANVPALPPANPDPSPEAEGESSYTSETFGYTLTWTDDWVPYEDGIDADPDEGYDMYTLENANDLGAGIYVVGGTWDEELDVDDYIDYWSSDEYLEENEPRGTEVFLADSGRDEGAVVLVGPVSDDDDELWVSVYEIRVVDDEVHLELSFVSELGDFEDAYDDAQDTITVAGEPIIGYFSTDEIMDVLPDD